MTTYTGKGRIAACFLLVAAARAQNVFPPPSSTVPVPTMAGTGFTAFTTHPQTTATLSDTPIGISIVSPDYGADNINAACQAAPATPYTLTGKFTLLQNWVSGDSYGGFAWRDSASGKIIGLGLLAPTNNTGLGNFPASTPSVYSIDWSNPTTAAGSTEGFTATLTGTIYLQISDNGTNASESLSYDGQNFLSLADVAKSSGYLGSSGYNQVCIFLSAHGSAAALSLQSYSRTSP